MSHRSASPLGGALDARPLDRGLAILLDLSRRLAGSLEIGATLRAVADTVVPSLADWALVDIVGEDGKSTHREGASVRPEHRELLPELVALPLTPRSLAYRPLQTGEPVWVPEYDEARLEDETSSPSAAHIVRALGIRSVISAPLRSPEGVLGVLTIVRGADRSPFADHHLELAMAIAVRAGLALGAARASRREGMAREEAERMADRLCMLQRLGLGLAAAGSTSEVARALNAHAHALLGAQRWAIAVRSRRPGWLDLVGADSVDPEVRVRSSSVPLGADEPLAITVREDRAVYRETAAEIQVSRPEAALDVQRDQASAIVPLRSSAGVGGALALAWDEPHTFDASERSLIDALAAQVSVVLERVALYERAQRDTERHRFLARASEALSSSLDHEITIRRAAEAAVPAFADWSVVDLIEPDGTARRIAAHHAHRAQDALARVVLDRPVEPVVVSEPSLVPEVVPGAGAWELDEALGARSRIRVPVRVRGEIRCVLTFVWSGSERHYDRDDLDVALDLARRAGTALEHAMLYSAVRAAEREVERSRKLFAQMASATPDTLFVVDARTGRNIYVNRLLDHEPEWLRELGPDMLRTLVHPDDFPGVLERMRRLPALRDGELLQESYRMRHADGSYRWLEVRSVVFRRDETGAPAELLGIARDVTRERERDDALRRSEETHRLATEAVRGLVYEWDVDTNEVRRSSGVRDVIGYDVDDIPADMAWWHERIHPDDLATVGERWARLDVSGEPVSDTEYRVRHRDGSWRHVWDRACLLRDEHGRVVRLVGCAIDVTERVRAREALEQADRRKTEFLALLGHELRNPLAAIRNAVHLLGMLGPPDPPQVRARDVIVRQVGHMARLLDDLLDLSRIGRGKLGLRVEPLDLREVVRHGVEDHRDDVERVGIALRVDLPDAPVPSAGDTTRLSQVLGNLLHNATKFTPRGGHIGVALHVAEGRAIIEVRDDGMGIAPEAIERIFEPFVQDELSGELRLGAASQGGLGLGLALVRGLVELHGGTVRAESEGAGRGATLVLTLPLRATEERSPKPTTAPPTRGRRVLIVEDNLDAAEMLRLLLEHAGHAVEVAYTGTEAVVLARSHLPEVVLCDVGLPGAMSGYDVARALRADPQTAGARLVALTGYGQEDDQRRAADAGFDLHVTKPVDPRGLDVLLGNGT